MTKESQHERQRREAPRHLQLKWQAIHHPCLSVRSDDLSINNESDWERMAEYHSVWSKKIYDVLVPYVREYVRAKTIDA